MENRAVYVVLAVIVIIITIMVWNRKVDKYSLIHGCQTRFRNIADATERNLRVQECLGNQIMKYGGQQCTNDKDCQTQQVCVLGGYYTDKDGNVFPNPDVGTCMDENDPGAVQWKHRSGFHNPHLPDHHHDDPTFPYKLPSQLPTALHDREVSAPCLARCLSEHSNPAICKSVCGLPDRHDDPTFPYKLPSQLPTALHDREVSAPCLARCLSEHSNPAICKSVCGLPDHPSKCMSKCISEGTTVNACYGICDPSHPYRNIARRASGTDTGECISRCMTRGQSDLSTCQNMCGMPDVNLKGPGVACASRCISESDYEYGDTRNIAKECRTVCGLPNHPSACMRRCKSERGSAAECHGICDPPTPPDNGDDSPPSWAFTMSGEITPSKVENYGLKTCLPGMYWNAYGNGGRGGCENIYQGTSSSWYLNRQKPDADAEVSIPGTTLLGYGVGMTDPMDKPTGVTIASDPGYKKN